jgi:hypothetical protein
MIRNIAVLFVLFAVAVGWAAAGYNVTLSKPAVVGGTEIKAGNYKLELDGDKAVLRNGKTSVEADVTVETNPLKFDRTSACCVGEDGKYHLQEIRVGGTTTKVTFKESSGMAVGK